MKANRTGSEQEAAQLAALLQRLARHYRERAEHPRDFADRINRHELLELAEGAEEFAQETAARAHFACAT